MTTTLKITAIGNSFGLILPKEIMGKLKVEKGDSVLATETSNGIEISPYNPEVARQLEIAERIMREDRDVLRKLADS